jgi:branched-chain amino acid aminotransferase
MNKITTKKLHIEKVTTSSIHEVDFTNLVFGKTFTDHMFECDYKDGTWQTPTIKPYGPMTMYPGAKVFHYGQAVFEGMKAYKDDNDDVFLFRPDQNIERFNLSSKRMAIPEFPEDVFLDTCWHGQRLDTKRRRKFFVPAPFCNCNRGGCICGTLK